MEFIKKNWKNILIAVLVIFSLNKCAVACNRAKYCSDLKRQVEQKDSIISVNTDSIKTLNTTISVYNEKVNGLKAATDIQEQAIKKITEAKKNINVNVKRQ